jgi:hypothetical protein
VLDPPTPATIVATIPEWLGRRPIAGETVLVGFSEYDDAHAVTITLDPNRDPTDEVAAIRQAVLDGVTDLAIVTLTGSENPQGPPIGAVFLAAAAERYGLRVLGALVVVPPQREAPGYWRNLPDPTRHPLPPSYTRTEETS